MGFSGNLELWPRMRNSIHSILRRLAAETGGAEIAEAAAVLPLMFMILLGIFWFGQAFSIYGAITRAAQEGARAGAAPYCAVCGNNTLTQYKTNAVNTTKAVLISSKLDPTQAQYPTTPPVLNSCISGDPVFCPTGGNICVQAPVELTSASLGP